MEQLCIRSFLQHGHEFHLYVYGQVDGVPAGTRLLDANQIVPSSSIFSYADHHSYAGFANLFRYKLLLERGGWWVDTDTVCLGRFDFAELYVFSSENHFSGNVIENSYCVNNGVIKAPRRSSLMRRNWELCQRSEHAQLKWGDTGPKLMADSVSRLSLEQFIQPPQVFCPIHFSQWAQVLDPNSEWRFGKETRAVHLWNEMWRRNNCSKDAAHDPSCLYERLKSQYLEHTGNAVA